MKTKKEMIDFLKGHFRYSTMNSWNGASSYAANVKLHRGWVPRALQDKAYELLDVSEAHERIGDILRWFSEEHNHEWQAGFNGRSGGYIVLYQGSVKPGDWKSFCSHCGQKNFQVSQSGADECGVCHARPRLNYAPGKEPKIVSTSMRGIDEDPAELEGWSIEELRRRVKIVRDFDRMVESCKREWLNMAKNAKIEEQTYFVQKTRKILAD